jgi:hypothetical protein
MFYLTAMPPHPEPILDLGFGIYARLAVRGPKAEVNRETLVNPKS